ncbi:hypothetical protein PSMK_12090 [Phycisphaera mikurensis NBRC 102666]|uniref:DUF58 domain-containing protein n=1 Tax=Phycisphaera mikurensis (strain NBRC 102666 / KCTC 22515 / FYK2301M01) TaxID=1142394 RepID=I0IDN0_PHYMF|nr:hypothetical protein PSMK_12090 [Phycisphaera mikurensis NBRC 102666]
MPVMPSPSVLLLGLETLRGRTLEPPARAAARAGAAQGSHRIRRRGRAHDFTGYRAYVPGDDVRDVDWKVYGRTERLYLRMFEDTTDLTLHLVLDASASMGWSGWPKPKAAARPWSRRSPGDDDPSTAWRSFTKLRHASAVACLLAAVAVRQRDPVELAVVQRAAGHDLRRTGPLRGSAALGLVVRGCELIKPLNKADLAAGLRGVGRGLRRRASVKVFTDGLAADRGQDEAFAAAVRGLTAQGHAVEVVHTLHPQEWEPPAGVTRARVRDVETGRVVRLDAGWREAYRERVREEADLLAARVRAAGGFCRRVVQDAPPWEVAAAICDGSATGGSP